MSRVRNLVTAAVLAAAFALPASAGLTVTATGHAGFLFSDGKTKILIDALTEPSTEWPYDAPAPDVLAKMENGKAPFDGVTLLLISHDHVDHYAPGATLKFLIANPQAVLVTTAEVRARLKTLAGFEAVAGRIVAPDLAWKQASPVTVGGVTVELDRLKHGDDGRWACQVDAFVFTLGGKKVLYATATDGHFPDEYRAFGYAGRHLDLAFINAAIAIQAARPTEKSTLKPQGVAALKDLIGAKTTVLIHVIPETVPGVDAMMPALEQTLPGVTRFRTELESRTY